MLIFIKTDRGVQLDRTDLHYDSEIHTRDLRRSHQRRVGASDVVERRWRKQHENSIILWVMLKDPYVQWHADDSARVYSQKLVVNLTARAIGSNSGSIPVSPF